MFNRWNNVTLYSGRDLLKVGSFPSLMETYKVRKGILQ